MTLQMRPCCLLLAIALLPFKPVLGQEAKLDYRLREVLTVQHDTEAIDHVAVSPDGKRIVACCSPWHHLAKANYFLNGHAKVWDADRGKLLLTLRPKGECVTQATFSPDGKRILTGHLGGEPDSERQIHTVKIWDAATGKLQGTTRNIADRVQCLTFTPDGKRFVSGSHDHHDHSKPGELIVWDANTGNELFSLRGHESRVTGVTVTPDGKRIVSSSVDETARVWDANTAKELLVFKGHDGKVTCLAMSPDGKRVVSTQRVWNPRTDKPRVLIWDIATGKTLVEIKGLHKEVRSLAFSPDGRFITGGIQGNDNVPGRLVVWDAATGREIAKITVEWWVLTVVFHPDGHRIVGGDARKNVKVWRLER